MKKIRDAYHQGQKGDQLRNPSGRVVRAAHKIGMASYKAVEREAAAIHEIRMHTLEKVIDLSKGPNKTALQIIRAAVDIPHQSSSNPAWSRDVIDPNQRLTDGYHKTVGKKWEMTFVHVPSTTQESEPGLGATPVSKKLGNLQIDDMYWHGKEWLVDQDSMTPADSVRVPVDSISLIITAPLDEQGNLQPASTLIHLNSRKYHTGDDKSVREERDRDYQREFGEVVKFGLGPQGNLEELAVSRYGTVGMVDLDPFKAKVGAEAFLQDVLASVEDTASMYRGLQQGFEPPLR